MTNKNDDSRIVRKKRKKFSQISNNLIADPTISNDAKALYGIIQYFIDIPDFKLYKNTCKKSFKGGDYTFRNAWKELKDLGYLVQIREHIDGRYVYCYELLDELDSQGDDSQRVDNHQVKNQPFELQGVENQHVEFQQVENQPIYQYLNNNNININNNKLNNKSNINNINQNKTNNSNDSTIVEEHGDLVVVAKENTIDRGNNKGFDISRFVNSPSVQTIKQRIDEATKSEELSKQAIKYVSDSCNCYGINQIRIINSSFTDNDYSVLFKEAIGLCKGDDPSYESIMNPKAYLSSIIRKCINKYDTKR